MRHIKLKQLVLENQSKQSRQWMIEALEKDLDYLQERLIEEGLWDTIKQKVGGVLDKTKAKTKELLLKPLIKVILDRAAKNDPENFSKLTKYAKQDPKNIDKLLSHPNIEKQQDKVEKQLDSVKESLTEQEADDFIQEYIDAILVEANVLKDDPQNLKRKQRYAERKAARQEATTTGSGASGTTTVDVEPERSPTDDIKQGAKQLGRGLARGADKLGIAAIEKTGDAVAGVANLVKKGMSTKAGMAVSGLISKVYNWAKAHPKITTALALGVVGLLVTVASIGSGGLVPLIMGAASAGGIAAVKGGAAGAIIGAGKSMYDQIKAGKKSFKGMDWKQIAIAAKDGLFKGGKYGFFIGAGMHIAGQALAGVAKMTATTAQATGDVALTKTSVSSGDWINNPEYAVRGQVNLAVDFNGAATKFRVPKVVYDQVMRSYGVNPVLDITDPVTLQKAVLATGDLLNRYQSGEFLNTAITAAAGKF